MSQNSPILTEAHPRAAHGHDVRRRRWTLLLMCVATFMVQLDVTVVNVALPRIQQGLDMGPAGLEWLIGAYALSLAAFIPLGGALGDSYGRKRVFIAGLTIFTLASGGCGMSPTPGALIAARALQGVGGAAMLALTLSIVSDTFPTAARARAIGTWAAVGGTGFGVGPAVGGLLLTHFGWSSVFWLNVPFGIAAAVGTACVVRESRNHAHRQDVLGMLLSATGLLAATFSLIEVGSHPWHSVTVLAPLALGIGSLVAFAGWQRRTPHAMMPPRLLAARSFTVATAVYLISYMSLSATLYYVSLLYQNVVGWSVLRTGLSWLLMNAPFLFAAQLTGRIERRYASTVVIGGGCMLGVVGVAALAAAGPTTPFALTAVGYLLSGAGFGILVPALSDLAMRDVPSGVTGAASALLNASRQIGTSVGLAVLGAIATSAIVSDWYARTEHFRAAVRAAARQLAPRLGGGQVDAVARVLGPTYRQPAAQSFAHGYHLALGSAAGCLVLAAAISVLGLRRRPTRPGSSTPRWQARRIGVPTSSTAASADRTNGSPSSARTMP